MQLNTHLNKDRQIVDVIFKLNVCFLGGSNIGENTRRVSIKVTQEKMLNSVFIDPVELDGSPTHLNEWKRKRIATTKKLTTTG